MSEIDSLEIKIDAEAKKANTEIDKLITKLGALSKSLGGIDANGLQKLSNGVSTLASSMQKFQGIKLSDFSRIAKGIQKFESVDASKLSQLSTILTPLATGISTLSNTNFDNKGLTNFINSITRLSNSNISGLGSVNFAQLGANINSLTSVLNNSKSVASNTIQIVNAVARLASAGDKAQTTSASLPALGSNLSRLISALAKSGTVSENTIQFASALGLLASAGNRTGQTASNLSALATELNKFMVVMSKAPNVSSSVIQMTQALGTLASNGNRVGTATRGVSSALNMFSNSAGKATKKSFSLASAIGKVYATYWMLFRALKVFRQAIDISGALTEVQNVVSHAFGPSMDKVEEQAKSAIKTLGMSELSFKQYASTYQSMGLAMGITAKQVGDANKHLEKTTGGYVQASDDMADVSLNLTKLAGDIASFYDKDQASVAEDLQSVYTGMVVPMRKYGLDLTQATLKQWAMNNGLNANIDSMSQAEKTMLRYQYVMSQTTMAQGDFARTAGTWNNQVRLLSENFKRLGSVWGNAFINMLKPLLTALNKGLDAVINFSESIVNALGAIFGWKLEIQRGSLADDFEDAAGGADDLASGTGKAADNAKKLKQQLQGFDELNVLTTPSDGSSGGGKGSGSGGSASGGSSGGLKFNVTETDGLYKSSIKNLEQLGEYISDALTKSMNGIDWNKVYKGAENFGKGLADFLNGLISPDLFYATGKTIAGALNTAIYTALSFGENFDFKDFGLSIASGINGFFDTFDFKSLAKTLNTWAKGLKDAFVTAITNIDWKDVIKGAFEFLDELDLGTMTLIIGSIWWKKKGGELFKNGIGALLSKEVSTGIGDKTISVGNAIKISIAVAIAGFKIGNWLYENTNISKFSDAIAAWIVDDNGNINIAKALAVAIPSLALSIGAVSLGAKAVGAIKGAIINAAATAASQSSSTIAAGGALSKIGKVGGAIGACILVGVAAYKIGEKLYKQFSDQIDSAVSKTIDYVKGFNTPSDPTDTNDKDYSNIYDRAFDLFNGMGLTTEQQSKYAIQVADAWETNMARGMNSVDAFAKALDTAEKLGAKIPPTMRRIGDETKNTSTVTGKAADELYHYGDQYKKTTKQISNYGDKYKNGEQKNTKTTIRAYENLSKGINNSSSSVKTSLSHMSNYGDKYKQNVEQNKTPIIRAYQELTERLNSAKNSTNSSMKSMSTSTKSTMSSMSGSVGNYTLAMHNNVIGKFNAMNTNGSGAISKMATSVISSISGMESTSKAKIGGMESDSKTKFKSMKDDSTTKATGMKTAVIGLFDAMKTGSTGKTSSMKTSVLGSFDSMKKDSTSKTSGMKTSVLGLFDSIKTGSTGKTSSMRASVIAWFDSMKSGSLGKVSSMKTSTLGFFDMMKSGTASRTSSMNSDIVKKYGTMAKNSSSGGTDIKKSFLNGLDGLRSGSNQKWNGVDSDTKSNLGNTRGTIRREQWGSIGEDLVDGLRIGLENKWSGVGRFGLVGAIVSLASGLTGALKRAFGIKSPSRVWKKEIGQYLPLGIGAGMEKSMPVLLSQATSEAKDLTSAFNSAIEFSDPLADLSSMSADIASSINTDVSASTTSVIDTGRMSTDIASGIVDGMSMSQADQNRLLREQNDLLRQLLQKDVGISSNDIFESVKRSNRQAYNRTGTNPLMY